MKLKSAHKAASLIGVLLGLSVSVQAGSMGPTQGIASEKIYFSLFGGGGSSNQINMSQSGTAFFPEINGGPLAVNAFGQTSSLNVGIVGGHIGYQWSDLLLNVLNNQTSLAPAIELEGYYLGKGPLAGHDINNDTTRLAEHDFLVNYPMSTGVFLANTVLNLNLANYSRWHPYVAEGIGGAVLSISNANSLQTDPLEPNFNHYNANPNDTVAAFAAQTKVGLNFSFNEHLSIFAEYRWLYIANTHFAFGSTVYTTHVPTSSWNANFGAQSYNMGVGGIRFTV